MGGPAGPAERGQPLLHRLGEGVAVGALHLPGDGADRGGRERVGRRADGLHL